MSTACTPWAPSAAPTCSTARRRHLAALQQGAEAPPRLSAGRPQAAWWPARPQCGRRTWRAAAEPPSRSGSGGSSSGRAAELEAAMYGGGEVPLSRLQAQLEAAVEGEDYELAAQLRDTLQRRRFDARLAVEEANERFYAAFQSGSLAAMGEVWGKGEHVQCIHPQSGCIAGRQAVMESWKFILGAGRLRIALEDVRVYASDSHAFVTCVEVTESGEGRGRIAATNVFEKQGGAWKLVHHHGSPMRRAPV